MKTLGEFETRPHAFLAGEIILESLRLLADQFLELVSVRRSKLVDTTGLHFQSLLNQSGRPRSLSLRL
jgi:hypothetical protein